MLFTKMTNKDHINAKISQTLSASFGDIEYELSKAIADLEVHYLGDGNKQAFLRYIDVQNAVFCGIYFPLLD